VIFTGAVYCFQLEHVAVHSAATDHARLWIQYMCTHTHTHTHTHITV